MISEDVYWLVHHDVTGKPRTSDHAAGVMVSAGVLAELVAADHACVIDKKMAAHVPVTATDPLHAGVLAQTIAENDRYPLRQWLEFLSVDMCERVAKRMVSAGRARKSSNPLHRSRVVANDRDQRPAWVHNGLVDAMRHGRTLDAHQRFLLSLVRWSGMNEHPASLVADDSYVRYALSQLSTMPASWTQLADAADDLIRAGALVR